MQAYQFRGQASVNYMDGLDAAALDCVVRHNAVPRRNVGVPNQRIGIEGSGSVVGTGLVFALRTLWGFLRRRHGCKVTVDEGKVRGEEGILCSSLNRATTSWWPWCAWLERVWLEVCIEANTFSKHAAQCHLPCKMVRPIVIVHSLFILNRESTARRQKVEKETTILMGLGAASGYSTIDSFPRLEIY